MEKNLPVENILEDFGESLVKFGRCILQAPAGSGKSTLIPQFLADHIVPSGQRIVVLQPRRMAARMLAAYIARQRNGVLGQETGYQIRLENMSSSDTKILFVTEGILMNRLLQGDLLPETGVIVFDEFHERHTETDISLALALKLQHEHRPDLKLVAMSATLDTVLVEKYLSPCRVIKTEGRQYPVKVTYDAPKPYDLLWDVAVQRLEAALPQFEEGSVLIFMPGAYEIRKTIETIHKRPFFEFFEVYPLYGSLPKSEQDMAIQPGRRKIIVTTNVAETSLTIPGVRLVIDSGLARVSRFDPRRGINTLFTETISRASADQRAGRAGRTAPGSCIRLWSEFEHRSRIEYQKPEIQRIDISEILLGLMASGVSSLQDFPWLEKPSDAAIEKGIAHLNQLGAIDEEDSITPLGRDMAGLGLSPRIGRMLMKAKELNCLVPACLVAAITQSGSLLNPVADEVVQQERLYHLGDPQSDLLFELHAWLWAGKHQFKQSECRNLGINASMARQTGQLALQLLHRAGGLSRENKKLPSGFLSDDEQHKLRECIFHGFVDYMAVKHRSDSPVCRMMHGRSGKLHQSSIVHDAKLMVATELEEVKSPTGVQMLLRKVTAVDESWIGSVSMHGMNKVSLELFDPNLKKAVRYIEHRLGDLTLSRETLPVDDQETASRIYTEAIKTGDIDFPQWDEEVEHFIRRVNFAANNAPDYGIPVIDEEAITFLIQQAIYTCRNLKEIQRVDVWPVLKNWLNAAQTESVDYLAPVSISLPRKRHPVKLRYDEKGDVVLSETIQALYDCPYPLTVAGGKVQVVYEILAPSRRPVQITRDLDYFWKNSYHTIKKELKGRYPKHEWR